MNEELMEMSKGMDEIVKRLTYIKGDFSAMKGVVGELLQPFSSVQSAISDIQGSSKAIGDIFNGNIGILDGVAQAFDGVVSSAENISTALKSVSTMKSTFTDLSEMAGVTKLDFGSLGSALKNMPMPDFSAVVPIISALGGTLMTAAASAWAFIAPILAVALPIIAVVAAVALLMNHLGLFSDISKVFSGDMSLGEFFVTLKDKLFGFVTGIIEAVPQIIENGKNLIIGFINGIVEVLPKVVATGLEMITSFLGTIIAAVPGLLLAGATLLINFISGLATIMPTVIATILTLMVSFVAMILSAIPKLISAGVEILVALVSGIYSVIGQLFSIGAEFIAKVLSGIASVISSVKEKGAEVLASVKEGIKEKISEIPQLGQDIIQGLIDGINKMKSFVVDVIKNVAKGMITGIKSVFGIKSPSRVMKKMGGYMSIGLANGINSERDKVKRATDKLAEAAKIDPNDLAMSLSDMRSLSTPLTLSSMVNTTSLGAESNNAPFATNNQTIQFNQPISRPSEVLRKMRQANQEMGWSM